MDLPRVLDEVALALADPILRLLCRTLRVIVALLIVFGLICYSEEVAASEMVLVFCWVVGLVDVDGITYIWVEFHTTHISSNKVRLSRPSWRMVLSSSNWQISFLPDWIYPSRSLLEDKEHDWA